MALFIAQPWDTPLSISSLIKYISILVVVVVAVSGWFVSWISFVVIQRSHTLQELSRVCGGWSETFAAKTLVIAV